MAKFGRMKLMATAIRRFLVQLMRHDEGSYNALRKAVREPYEASDSAVFGWKTLDDDGVNQLRQSIAEDLAYLVERYRRNKDHNSRSTYLMLVKVFEQQCDVVDEKVVVKKKQAVTWYAIRQIRMPRSMATKDPVIRFSFQKPAVLTTTCS